MSDDTEVVVEQSFMKAGGEVDAAEIMSSLDRSADRADETFDIGESSSCVVRIVCMLSRRSARLLIMFKSFMSYFKSASSFFLSKRKNRLDLLIRLKLALRRSINFEANGITTSLLLLLPLDWDSA